MKWDCDLFVELSETMQIMPPKAGLPPGLDAYAKDGVLHQPLVRRKNCLSSDWSHINMARAERPMTPMELKIEPKACFFCKGHEDRTPRHVATEGDYLRAGGEEWTLRAFPNLYPWMIEHQNIVQTADHKVSISQLDDAEELEAWKVAARITGDLEKQKVVPMLFRNHGWGSSIAHYHWQVGALPYIPAQVKEELTNAEAFCAKWKTNLFDALIQSERALGKRFVAEDEHVAVVTAYAPKTAFETWVICKDPVTSLAQCSEAQLRSFCTQLNAVLRRLHSASGIDTMNIIFHQLPESSTSSSFRLHVEIMPFKLQGGAERGFREWAIEVTPERAASMLAKAS